MENNFVRVGSSGQTFEVECFVYVFKDGQCIETINVTKFFEECNEDWDGYVQFVKELCANRGIDRVFDADISSGPDPLGDWDGSEPVETFTVEEWINEYK